MSSHYLQTSPLLTSSNNLLPFSTGVILLSHVVISFFVYFFCRRSYPERLTVSTETFSNEASRVKCLAQGHSVILHGRESNRQPSDEQPDSLTARPSDPHIEMPRQSSCESSDSSDSSESNRYFAWRFGTKACPFHDVTFHAP